MKRMVEMYGKTWNGCIYHLKEKVINGYGVMQKTTKKKKKNSVIAGQF